MAQRIIHHVRSVQWSDHTDSADGDVRLARDELAELVRAPCLERVRLSLVAPGDATRVLHVVDVVEPRARRDEGVFPGILSPARPPGDTDVHVARGLMVVTACELTRTQEAVLDFGEAARYTPFGGCHALVCEFAPAPGADPEDVAVAVRRGALQLAQRIGRTVAEQLDGQSEAIPAVTPPSANGRTRVGVITNIQTQGAFKDTYVYGRSGADLLPTLLDPVELDVGAVVSGQYGHPGLRNPTYIYQNHPVLAALAGHVPGDVELGAVIVAPEPDEWDAKQMISDAVVRLARACGLDTVLITKEGGGNADADLVLKADRLAAAGLHVVGVAPESAGRDGTDPPLVTTPQTARHFVSAGNYDETVRLPAAEHLLGGTALRSVSADPAGELEVPMAMLCAALNPLGATRVRCAEAVG